MGLFDLTSSACTHRLSLVRTSSFNRMPWMRTPEAVHSTHHCEPCTSAFPVERVGRLFRSRSISRLLTPFICIPAYGFPVYASQWVLPPTHARLGTWHHTGTSRRSDPLGCAMPCACTVTHLRLTELNALHHTRGKPLANQPQYSLIPDTMGQKALCPPQINRVEELAEIPCQRPS